MRGRDVLLVDDILDTGKTLARVLAKLRRLQPRRIKVCVLLDKPATAPKTSPPITSASPSPMNSLSDTAWTTGRNIAICPSSACWRRKFSGALLLEQRRLFQRVENELHRHRRQQQPEQTRQQFQRQRVQIMRPAHRQPENPVSGKARQRNRGKQSRHLQGPWAWLSRINAVEIAPGPASIGTPSGVMAMSSLAAPAATSSSVYFAVERLAYNISSAIRSSRMLPAI